MAKYKNENLTAYEIFLSGINQFDWNEKRAVIKFKIESIMILSRYSKQKLLEDMAKDFLRAYSESPDWYEQNLCEIPEIVHWIKQWYKNN